MAIQGSLRTLHFPDLLSLIHQLRKTGLLTLISEVDERAFLFQCGDIVYATAKDPHRRLGAFLVRLGILGPDDLEGLDSRSSSGETYFGQCLVEAGKLSPEDLRLAVRNQIFDIVEEVVAWQDGAFHFEEDEVPFAVPEGTPVSARSVIFEIARRADEREFVRSLFPDRNLVLGRPEPERLDADTPPTAAVIERIDGRRTIEQVIHGAPIAVQEAARAIKELVDSGRVRTVAVAVSCANEQTVPDVPHFPVSPSVPGKLFSAFGAGDDAHARIAQAVADDPVLAARLLKEAALRGVPLTRANLGIQQILRALGLGRAKGLLVPEAVRGLYFPAKQFFWKELWEHSVTVAKLCRAIALRVGHSYADEAYLAGLLHNLGAFLLLHQDASLYRKVATEASGRRWDMIELEEKGFGISHVKVGAVHAEKWGFPRTVVAAIRHHHRPDRDPGNVLLQIVSVANGVAGLNGIGVEYSSEALVQFEFSLEQLHLTRSKAMSLLRRNSVWTESVPAR